jgi:hypothetical protein
MSYRYTTEAVYNIYDLNGNSQILGGDWVHEPTPHVIQTGLLDAWGKPIIRERVPPKIGFDLIPKSSRS